MARKLLILASREPIPDRLLATMIFDVQSSSNASIGRWRPSRTKAEQCLKGGHRLPPTIVPKHELIQIDLQLCLTDPMVGTDEPLLQVPNRAVRKRHHRGYAFAQLGPERLRTGNIVDVSASDRPACDRNGDI